ncbi:helix-turn-helix transcriptional regulator [Thauera sp.]|jgi:transcriptional regulator with XRE-family HTH domain|uniref:helix-turn-helix domain-containing protein n=1 Tax=Thauera sp. TaxID=1905334 RepID=UPI002579FC6B|nr:helix-turn-helix transcriptional regulator [Thauera sp.]
MKRKALKGSGLTTRIKERMRSEGVSVTGLAERLGVSQPYLSQILGGDKSFTQASDDLIRRVAGFLYLPPVVCFVLAERLVPSDFETCSYDNELLSLERRAAFIAESTFALEAGVTKQLLMEADPRMLSLVLGMYEVLVGPGELISKKERWSWQTSGEK